MKKRIYFPDDSKIAHLIEEVQGDYERLDANRERLAASDDVCNLCRLRGDLPILEHLLRLASEIGEIGAEHERLEN
jgi:hypothetical protein